MILSVGTPRLRILNTDGTTLKTYVLPPPNKGDGLTLEWAEKSYRNDLVDGSERTRRLGYIPVLTIKWKIYDDRADEGRTIGTADGNTPTITELLHTLATTPGLLKISHGPDPAGGFRVNDVKVSPIGVLGTFATGLQVVFRGRDIQADQNLGTF